MKLRSLIGFLLFLMAISVPAFAYETHASKEADENSVSTEKEGKEETKERPEKISRTSHSLSMDGLELSYTATAGEILVKREKPETTARLFYIAYETDEENKTRRPVTFVFNGGPGAASVWLHLGGLGPQRINLTDDGLSLPPPVGYGQNPYTWLSFTDLVFIDPVGTGFSRAEPSDEKTSMEFYGITGDVASVADFIRRYLSKNGRWTSPKFLAGESYGTTRAASLAWHLHQKYGISLNGIVLVSPVLDYDTILFHQSNDLPYALSLPTYAATAWHYNLIDHEKWQNSVLSMLQEVEDFCLNEYIVFLAKGDAVEGAAKEDIKKKLNEYSGLPEDLIEERNFRIDWITYTKNILKKDGLLTGRMDTTVTGPDTGEPAYPAYDPSLDPLYGPFSSAMNDYVRKELLYDSDLPYEFLNKEVNARWDWSSGLRMKQGFIDVSHTLRDAMMINRHLRVFIASGIYDLATPYFSAKYTVAHMWLKDEKSRVLINNYDSGHMVFTHRGPLDRLTTDVKAFYQTVLEGTTVMKTE